MNAPRSAAPMFCMKFNKGGRELQPCPSTLHDCWQHTPLRATQRWERPCRLRRDEPHLLVTMPAPKIDGCHWKSQQSEAVVIALKNTTAH